MITKYKEFAMSVPRRYSLVLMLLFSLLAGCGGSGGSNSDGDQPRSTVPASFLQACSQLDWPELSVDPLSGIKVTNLPESFAAMVDDGATLLNAKILVDGNLQGAMPLKRISEGGETALQIAAPAHPANPFDGGDLDIALAFGGSDCPTKSVSVAALPEPADPQQTIDDAVAQLETWVMNRASVYGIMTFTDLTDMRDRFDSGERGFTTGELLLIATANAVEGLKAATAPGKLDAEGEKLLGAMIAAIGDQGFVQGLANLNGELNTIGVTAIDPDTLPPATFINRENGDFVQPMAAGSGACGAAIMGDPLGLDSAFELDRQMSQQKAALEASNSVGNDALDFLGATLPLAGLVGGPAGAAAGTGAGAMIYVYKLVQDITINTLPSGFDRVDLNLTPGNAIPEDYIEAGNAKPRWDNALATVSSNGMNLAGQTFDAVMQVFGAANWAGDLGGQSVVLQEIRGALDGFGLAYVSNIFKSLLNSSNASCFEVASTTWSGIDISNDQWTDARVIGGNVTLAKEGADINRQSMTLEKTGGPTTLIVETREGKFGGATGKGEQPIRVSEISLLTTPNPYWVQTLGEAREFSTQVLPTNAELPGKQLVAEKLEGGGSFTTPQHQAGGEHLITVTTPARGDEYPVRIKLTREATIPNQTGSTERTEIFSIRNDEKVALTPDTRCIGRGETLEMTAEAFGVANLNPGDLVWEITDGGGSVAPGAISGTSQVADFNAPASISSTQIKVSITSPSGNNEVADVSRIAVGTCDAQVAISGSASVSASAGSDRFSWDTDHDAVPLADLPTELYQKPDPSLYWKGRSESYSASGSVRDDVPVSCNRESRLDPEDCVDFAERSLSASSRGNASISADGDGKVAFELGYQGQDLCLAADDRYNGITHNPTCSSSDATAGWDIRYYLDIEEASTQELTINLQCSEFGGGLSYVTLGMVAIRQPSTGTSNDDMLPITIKSVEDLQARVDSGELTPDEAVALIQETFTPASFPIANQCEGGQESFTFTRTLEIPGPVVENNADSGVVLISVGLSGFMPHVDKADYRQLVDAYLDDLQSGTIPTNVPVSSSNVDLDGDTISDSLPGNYNGSVNITGSISLGPTQ
jgi:hypothetical protein